MTATDPAALPGNARHAGIIRNGPHNRPGVLHALAATADRTPNAVAIHAFDPAGDHVELTYRRLVAEARAVSTGLAQRGLRAADRVILALPTCAAFFPVYLGCLISGVVPIVLPGARTSRASLDSAHIESITGGLSARCVVIRDTADLALPDVVTAAELISPDPANVPGEVTMDDIAHLQGTSGTTAEPRWVIVRHRNVAANVAAIGRAVDQRPDDILVTWLPMSHDMGLIGVSYAWYWGIPLVAADPINFIRNPLFWLELITRYRGTLSPAPTSAFQVCSRVAQLRRPSGLDLSSWRCALCGAEPVHDGTLKAFHRAFTSSGLGASVLTPVYGLAEATLAVTISSANRPFRVDRISSTSCAPGAQVEQGDDISVVGCGTAVPDHELRIVDAIGQPVTDGVVGEIEFRGPSVVDGYLGIQRDDQFQRDDFLRTGDLGYLRNGELFITGRSKEILIINGRNFSPLQIEAAVERVLAPHFTPSVVAVEVPDLQLHTGELHLLLDGRLGVAGRSDVEARVRRTLDQVFGLRGARLHWVAGGRLPRTDSGKIQRHRCRELASGTG